MKTESFLSIVIPLKKLNKNKFIKLHALIESKFSDYEILLITDDETESYTEIDTLLHNYSSIRNIHLSGSVDADIKYGAACENSVGDFVLLFNLDSDPVDVIIPMYEKCCEGCDIVIGVAPQSRTLTYKVVRKLFNFILKGIEYSVPEHSTELRCLSRRAVNAITRTGRFHHKFYMRIQKSGYKQESFRYNIDPDFNEIKNISTMSSKLIGLLVFNSTRPLRWMSMAGCFGSLLAFVYATYSVVTHLISGHVADGWTTIILFMSSLFMILFTILSFMGEYIIRLLDDKSDKDDYSIVYEKNSFVMINSDRVNVMEKSESGFFNHVQTGRNN